MTASPQIPARSRRSHADRSPWCTSTTSFASSGAATGRCARSTASRCRWPAGRSPRSWGPSGSGKSTLLQLAAGLDRPTQGRVRLGEHELGGLNERALARLRRERLGFVFQSFNLLGALTAEQNVALPARLAGKRLPRSVVREVLQPRRPRRAPRPPAGAALGRPAAARRDRARPRRRAERRVRRRADRRARHALGPRRAGAPARDDRRDAAARSSWSPTTRPRPRGRIASCSWPTGGSPASCAPRPPSRSPSA